MDQSPSRKKDNKIVPVLGDYQRQRRGTLQDKRLEDVDDEIAEETPKSKGFFNDFFPKGLTTKKTAPKHRAKPQQS